MQSNNSNQRNFSKILIYPHFQVKLIIANLLLIFGIILAVGIQVHSTFNHLKEMGNEVGLAQSHPYFEFVSYQSNLINNGLLVVFIISAIISTVIIFYLSHRVAGPIVRLIRFFKDLRSTGEIQPLKFRKNDYFTELTSEVNTALDSLRIKEGKSE